MTGSLPGIDLVRISRWICSAVPQLSAPLTFQRVGRGRSNLTFVVEDAQGRCVVVRRPPLGILAPSAHDMDREYRILAILAHEAVPAPRPLAMCNDELVTGAPFYVMEHVEGLVLDTAEPALALDETTRARAGASLAATLAAIHEVGLDKVVGLGSTSSYAERQLRRWGGMWERTRTRDIPTVTEVAQALAAHVPPQAETTLVHGDFSLANVIVSESGHVAAVLDWELCTIGDPLADLGMLICYWPEAPDQALPERDAIPLLPGFPSRDELIAAYGESSRGRSLDALPFWIALSYWKLAIILEGVHRRSLEDPLNASSGGDKVAEAVDRMAALAAQEVAGW